MVNSIELLIRRLTSGQDREGKRSFLDHIERVIEGGIKRFEAPAAHVLALSNRPGEPALIEEDGTKEDLMSIPMEAVVFSIYDSQHVE